jgi:hypothetical protein
MTLYLNGTTGISGVDGSAGTPALQGTDTNTGISFPAADTIAFNEGGVEAARIDSSSRFLVGTSSGSSIFDGITPQFQIEGTGYNSSSASLFTNSNDANGAYLVFGKSRGTSTGSSTIVSSGDAIGGMYWVGADGTDRNTPAASIYAFVDGTPGANDMPGRLVFSTTTDGASSPTERMRITNFGQVLVGAYNPTGDSNIFVRTSGATVAYFDRGTNDGTIISLRQADIEEGTISVSGTTVSYNGAHLSRWSQLPGGASREEILRGTVLSNIDEMCNWGEEENEQLNRMQVSDVEGDPNVSGVFQAWDDDDDTYTDDFYCAMTGDFIIRIAEGVTVQRGDLLMSAGDGTAKPQDDDIIRSKTVAKVTSTHVTCTYNDGSYCVPCVLMAC